MDISPGPRSKAAKLIFSGTVTVGTAGEAVQVTTTSTPGQYGLFSSDAGNNDDVVIGNASVVAADGGQKGIHLPGPDPRRVDIDNLNKLYVDARSNGDKLCYAYFA